MESRITAKVNGMPITEDWQKELSEKIKDFCNDSAKEAVKTVETNIKEREKHTIEDGVRDHLRGFSRTIPSFLMAYGDDTVTLATFDMKVPENVFEEVTSITLEQFRFLRDGWNTRELAQNIDDKPVLISKNDKFVYYLSKNKLMRMQILE